MVLDTTSFWVPFQVPDQFVFFWSHDLQFICCRVRKFQLLRLRFVVRCTEFGIRFDLWSAWEKISAKKLTQKKTCKPCYLRNSTGDSNSQLSSNRNSLNVIESQSKQLIINNHRFLCLFVCLFVYLLERDAKQQDAHWTCQSDGSHISPNPLPVLIKISSTILKRFLNFYRETLQKKTTLKIHPPPRFGKKANSPTGGSAPLHQWHRGEKGRDSPEAFRPSTRERVGGGLEKTTLGNRLFHLLIKWIYMVSKMVSKWVIPSGKLT